MTDLTARQIEVLRLVARGDKTLAIANELNLCEKTVKNHIRRICVSLDAGY